MVCSGRRDVPNARAAPTRTRRPIARRDPLQPLDRRRVRVHRVAQYDRRPARPLTLHLVRRDQPGVPERDRGGPRRIPGRGARPNRLRLPLPGTRLGRRPGGCPHGGTVGGGAGQLRRTHRPARSRRLGTLVGDLRHPDPLAGARRWGRSLAGTGRAIDPTHHSGCHQCLPGRRSTMVPEPRRPRHSGLDGPVPGLGDGEPRRTRAAVARRLRRELPHRVHGAPGRPHLDGARTGTGTSR